jgi:N-acetylmuramoyl-L-alanine amidase
VEKRNLYVINQTVPAALFIELGNIQNSFDQQRFILHNNRQALANWMCDGLIADYRDSKR